MARQNSSRLFFARLFAPLMAIGLGGAIFAAAPLFDLDFLADAPGEPPASAASVSSGEGRRVIIVDASTSPADPFASFSPPGNRSLMLENAVSRSTGGASFRFPDGFASGALGMEIFLFQGHDGEAALTNPMLQFWLRGTPFYMYLRAARFVQARDGEETIQLDQRAVVNEVNRLLIAFDAEGREWRGWLNGEALTAGGGEKDVFALDAEAGVAAREVYLRAGSSRASGARVFVNRIRLTRDVPEPRMPPGRNMLPNADFTQTPAPREIHPAIGDYRHNEDGGWAIDRETAMTGGQSLRMEAGSRPFLWQVFDNEIRSGSYRSESVFSVYLRGERPGQRAEIGHEVSGFSDGGAIQTAQGEGPRTVELTGDWQRFEMPILVEAASWEPNTVPPHGVRLHRAWVRPLGEGNLWADAAQLENDRLEASPFDARRLSNDLTPHRHGTLLSRQWVDPQGPQDPLPQGGGPSKSGAVALRLIETCGFIRNSEPVRGGVPFPQGELFDPQAARLLDARGGEVPAQFAPLAHWGRDGSIKSLGVDFLANVSPGSEAEYRLEYGRAPAPAERPPLARDMGDSIVIDTGAARAVIRKGAFRWFDEIESAGHRLAAQEGVVLGSRVVGLGGEVFSSAFGPPDEVAIESNGPIRATVVVRGRHFDAAGERPFLHYVARIHAYAGKAHFLLEHVVENAEPHLHTPVEEISMRLPLAETAGGSVGFVDGTRREFAAPFLGVQRQQHDGAGEYDCVLEEGGADLVVPGSRLAGWVEAGRAAMAVHDFWQLHPSALEVSDALAFHHWPGRHVRIVDLPFGASMHARVAYAPFGARGGGGERPEGTAYVRAADGSSLGSSQVLFKVDPEWTAASGVFESFLTPAQTEEYAPGFEERVRAYFALVAREQDALGLTGMWNYGCNGTPQRWGNNEHTVCRNLWTQWLRTGDPADWRRAWTATRHIREVDICFGGPGARAQHYHFPGTHNVPAFGLGHYWLTGLVWHYLISGDMRSLDVARDAGAMGLMASGRNLSERGRQGARVLYALAELYEVTRLRAFREAVEAQYAFGYEPAHTRGTYVGGKDLMFFAKWHEATGDSAFLDRLRAEADGWVAEGAPLARFGGGGRGITIFSGLAEAARLTDEGRYVAGLRELLCWSTLHPGLDPNVLRASAFLYQAKRLGAGVPPELPEGVWGLAPATGRSSAFRFQVAPPAAGEAAFRVHFMRRRDGDVLRWQAKSADGGVVEEGELGGEEWATRELRFGAAEEAPGPYEVLVRGGGDARLEVSSSGGWTLLDAATPGRTGEFRMRGGTDLKSGFRFYLRAPLEGEAVEVALRWPAHWDEGGAAAALLEDLTGNLVTQARWVVPIGTAFDEKGEAWGGRAARLALPVPNALRGEVLALTIYAPTKNLRWQVQGLDVPWLAKDPAALLTSSYGAADIIAQFAAASNKETHALISRLAIASEESNRDIMTLLESDREVHATFFEGNEGPVAVLGILAVMARKTIDPIFYPRLFALAISERREPRRNFGWFSPSMFLARTPDPRLTAFVIERLEDEDEMHKELAAYLLAEIGDKKAVAPLESLFLAEAHWGAARALFKIHRDEMLPFLMRACESADAEVRWLACLYLGNLSRTEALPVLQRHLAHDESAEVRAAAAAAMRGIDAEGVVSSLEEAMKDPSPLVQFKAAYTLAYYKKSAAGADILVANLIENPEDGIREEAARGLIYAGSPELEAVLCRALEQEKVANVRYLLPLALERHGGPDSLGILFQSLTDEDDRVSSYAKTAIRAVVERHPEASRPLLERMAQEGEGAARELAEQCLGRLVRPRERRN